MYTGTKRIGDWEAFGKMQFSKDATEDFTAMLLAMKDIFDRITGSDDDLIDFTHILNKLAMQYIMEGGHGEE